MNEKILSTNGATIDEVGANFKKLQEMLQGMVDQISKRKSELEKGLEGVGTKIRDELLAQRRDILGLEDNSNTIVNQNLETLNAYKAEGERLQAERNSIREDIAKIKKVKEYVKELEIKQMSLVSSQSEIEAKTIQAEEKIKSIHENIDQFTKEKIIEMNVKADRMYKSIKDRCIDYLNDSLKKSRGDFDSFAQDAINRVAASEQTRLEAEKTYKKFTEFAAQQENKLIDSINDYIGKACQKALGKQLEELQEKELANFARRCEYIISESLKVFEQITKKELERISQLLEQTSAREIQRIEYVASYFTKRNILAALVFLMVFIFLLSLLFAWVFAPKQISQEAKKQIKNVGFEIMSPKSSGSVVVKTICSHSKKALLYTLPK